ncbi:MAG: T9SS type A sorting domain-containing protein [Chitinophagales bacterium]
MDILVYDMTGVLLAHQQAEEGQTINISSLPVGVYSVVIHKEGLPDETEKLVKMQ